MVIEQERASELIKKALSEIPNLRKCERYGKEHSAWRQTTQYNLSKIFGSQSSFLLNIANIRYHHLGVVDRMRGSTDEEAIEMYNNEAYQKGLDQAEGLLQSQLTLIQTHSVEEMKQKEIPSKGVDVFISHGKKTYLLGEVKEFVRALGLNPIVVMREPSKGRSVNTAVDDYMKCCKCAIILATCDDEIEDHFQPRQNVIHEIGKAEEIFGQNIIYLLEEGARLPSNVSEKVWEGFTQEDISPALMKIAKELTAFGFISPSV